MIIAETQLAGYGSTWSMICGIRMKEIVAGEFFDLFVAESDAFLCSSDDRE